MQSVFSQTLSLDSEKVQEPRRYRYTKSAHIKKFGS